MFNFGKQRKLQEERKKQEDLIAAQLKALELEHELEYEKLTQRGLVAHKEQKIAKEKEELQEKKKLARAASKSSADGSSTGENNGADTASVDDDSSLEDAQKTKEEMSYVEMARMGYQQLVNAIIRPPRCSYEVSFANLDFPREGGKVIQEVSDKHSVLEFIF